MPGCYCLQPGIYHAGSALLNEVQKLISVYRNTGKGDCLLRGFTCFMGFPDSFEMPVRIDRYIVELRIVVDRERDETFLAEVVFGQRGQINIGADISVMHNKIASCQEQFGVLVSGLQEKGEFFH